MAFGVILGWNIHGTNGAVALLPAPPALFEAFELFTATPPTSVIHGGNSALVHVVTVDVGIMPVAKTEIGAVGDTNVDGRPPVPLGRPKSVVGNGVMVPTMVVPFRMPLPFVVMMNGPTTRISGIKPTLVPTIVIVAG